MSERRTTPANVTDVYIKLVGTDLNNVIVQVTTNDGINFEATPDKTKVTLINQEKKLRVKVIFNSSTAKVDSLSVMYK